MTGDSCRAAWLRQARGRPAQQRWNMNGSCTHPDRIHKAHQGRLGPASCGNRITKGGPQ
jgi:hypothetical protein